MRISTLILIFILNTLNSIVLAQQEVKNKQTILQNDSILFRVDYPSEQVYWQRSSDLTDWINISETKSNTFNYSGDSSAYFRAAIELDNCGYYYTDTFYIEVNKPDDYILLKTGEISQWDKALIFADGRQLLVKQTNERADTVFFKPLAGEEGSVIYIDTFGLPYKMVLDSFIILYSNYRDTLFDMAIIDGNNQVYIERDAVHSLPVNIYDTLSNQLKSTGEQDIAYYIWNLSEQFYCTTINTIGRLGITEAYQKFSGICTQRSVGSMPAFYKQDYLLPVAPPQDQQNPDWDRFASIIQTAGGCDSWNGWNESSNYISCTQNEIIKSSDIVNQADEKVKNSQTLITETEEQIHQYGINDIIEIEVYNYKENDFLHWSELTPANLIAKVKPGGFLSVEQFRTYMLRVKTSRGYLKYNSGKIINYIFWIAKDEIMPGENYDDVLIEKYPLTLTDINNETHVAYIDLSVSFEAQKMIMEKTIRSEVYDYNGFNQTLMAVYYTTFNKDGTISITNGNKTEKSGGYFDFIPFSDYDNPLYYYGCDNAYPKNVIGVVNIVPSHPEKLSDYGTKIIILYHDSTIKSAYPKDAEYSSCQWVDAYKRWTKLFFSSPI